MLKLLKRIAPVGVGILLILLITVTVSLVKNANDRTPAINNADGVYASYGDLTITNEKLYTLMKNQYGLADILNLVDGELFKDEVEKIDVNDEKFVSFIKEQIFQVEDMSELDAEEAQEKWDEVIDSLRITGLLTKTEAQDNDYTNENSKVWTVVKDYYKLSYAREEWAKAEYLKKYLENREDGNMFDMTNDENSTTSVEKYFEENYTGKVTGLFIPFTSEKSALAMMEKYGINTSDKVLGSNDGWVSSTYDYFEKAEVEDEDMLTYLQVCEAFFKMYNEVYAYLNEGNDVITADSYEQVLKEANTVQAVIIAVKKELEKNTYGVEVTLPKVAYVDGQEEATITWSVENEKYGKIEENVLKGDFTTTDDGELDIKLNFEVEFKNDKSSGTATITLEGTKNAETDQYESAEDAIIAVNEVTVTPFYTYVLKDELLNNENFKFSWTEAEATEINATLANYLSVDSTNLTISTKPTEAYKSYTNEPVKIGNYYYLILKLEDFEQSDLFEKTSDGENKKDDNGNYIIADQTLYDEIVAKMTEELLTDNAINEMLYEKRYNHNVKFYDAYLEALYEYEYKYFYETTLSSTDYNEYKKTKKNKKDVVVTFQTEAGNKKSVQEIKAQKLFEDLEKKYAESSVATLIENYILITDTTLNSIYNPYTDTIINETSYKNLMNSEIQTLRKNFESDYFTYSYLSYYGFTPNFPAEYGWKKFIKDYFVVENDQELLTASTYGGSIYADALEVYIDTLATFDKINEVMKEAYDEWYSVSVINLIVSIDTNYDNNDSAENSAEILLKEKDNWTEEQIALAKELADLMYEVANQTNGTSLSDQMTTLVTLYNEAAYEYNETEWEQNKENNTSIYDYNYFGKYKLQGLNVKFETANTYDSSSSIMEPFAEECEKMWKQVEELGLLGKTLDVPFIGGEAFATDYGYHKIAVLSADEKIELPNEEEVKLYRALALYNAVVEEIATVDENIETYKASGYNISTYEAEKAYLETKLAKYEKALKDLLGDEFSDEYELDEEVQEKIDQWYTNAESEVEGGTLLTRSYIAKLTEVKNDITFANSNGLSRLEEFLELLLAQCDKTDAE
ncbi:MAG: hypothetical protein E7183_07175 [Erysipelotrichaceae bacterium]|nr:hypothetical protein [Erysipelotrichaceae bacterium]